MKKIVVLGSTGSIGKQTLEVIRNHPSEFKAVGLVCNRNIELLNQQIQEFKPQYVAIVDKEKNQQLEVGKDSKFFGGEDGVTELLKEADYDVVVVAISGAKGLKPTIQAIKLGKNIALATKEVMVLAGELINQAIASKNKELIKAEKPPIRLLPIDSEHSAIWQSLRAGNTNEIRKIILTCSGGPFRKKTIEDLKTVTVEQALKHPNWKMGSRITVDSATLMNKGLEIIEARWLFNLSPDQIEVVIHPQSILHSAVEFIDGSIVGQFGPPDMKKPIQYALSYPKRITTQEDNFSLISMGILTFSKPDIVTFPCLKYAYDALKIGGTMPTIVNAADEIAVESFLKKRISFLDIPRIIYQTMEKHQVNQHLSFDVIFEADNWARNHARTIIN